MTDEPKPATDEFVQGCKNVMDVYGCLIPPTNAYYLIARIESDREKWDKLIGGTYYHDLHCNTSRNEPMGCAGCSCTMYTEVLRLRKVVAAAVAWKNFLNVTGSIDLERAIDDYEKGSKVTG